MDTRADRLRTTRPDVVLSSAPTAGEPDRPAPSGPTGAPDGPPPQPPRRVVALVLAALLAVAVGVTGGLAVLGGDDGDVTTRPEPAAAGAEPAGPAALGLTVEAPEVVVAGERADFVVHWTDGSGVFSGGSEDWGDGVATSSLQQERCDPAAAAPGPAAGSYTASHAWTEPGTYRVVIGVSTYACENGTAVVEDASQTVTVEVRPAG